MTASASLAFRFNGFRVDPERRLLLGADGQPIPLKPKVFDVLLYLIERRGELVAKEALLEAVWPHVVVEENNLNKAISTLRQVFGETRDEHRFIVTEPGRGYRFVANLETVTPGATGASSETGLPRGKEASGSSNVLRLAGAVAATAVVAAVVGWLLHPAAVPEPKPVVRLSVSLPPEQSFNAEVSMIALSPDGTRIAYVASRQIFLRDLGESESRPVQGTAETGIGPVTPAFSPDGKWLAYVHSAGIQGPFSLKRVPISGGAPVTIRDANGLANWWWGLTWPTPDTILFATNVGIVSIPANGGATEILVPRGEDERFDSPQLLPGGKAVLFTRIPRPPGVVGGLEAAQVVVQSIGENDRTVVWEGGSAPRYLPTGHLVYAQGNTLFAIPFDADRRTVSGGPVPIVEGVRRSTSGFSDVAQYAVSDTGTLVTIPGVAAQPEVVLALVDRTGKVSPLDVPPAQYRSPRVSPDGKRVAVEAVDAAGRGQIWIYDLAGDSAIRRLTQSGNNTKPIWTPDSSSVTFGSERDGTWGIYEQPVDGSRPAERLTTAEKEHRHVPESWSPDGQTLAYTDGDLSTDARDLWTFSRPSEKAELFAGGDANRTLAAFSPDGRWLAYTNVVPPIGLEVQPFPATGVVHQIAESGEAPVWTAAGDELFFRTAQTNPGHPSQIKGVEIATAGGITFRNARTLPIQGAIMNFRYRDFDVTPDGERFVMIYPADVAARQGAPTDRIDVVLNWFEELKRRVAAE